MYKVFVADKLSAEGIAALKQYPEIEIDFAAGLSVADAIPHAAAADAIIVRSATKIKGELLAAATKVKVIGRAGIGVDNVDLDACTERGIVVLNTPDANATTTAELAIAHLFSLCRSLPAADASVRAGKWERNSMVGTEVSGKTIGIVGFGTIGRLFAERARGLKMRVIGFDPFVTEATFTEYGVEKVDLDTLVTTADFITLHCPVTKDTRGPVEPRAPRVDEEGRASHQLRTRRPGRRSGTDRTGGVRPSRRRRARRVRGRTAAG
jgi:D-3-phosphoglycerate dehydrogenase